MTLSLSSWLLTACLRGIMICERDFSPAPARFYEPDKSCYIKGVFYESCPKQN